jgi:hypothetical protein
MSTVHRNIPVWPYYRQAYIKEKPKHALIMPDSSSGKLCPTAHARHIAKRNTITVTVSVDKSLLTFRVVDSLTQYCAGNKIENEMGEACSADGGGERRV